ncbi:MAG: family 43 glycosylhydrolase [Clostridia bacterium]|nr:family 43 glycosylhydrolase [Clostridia bacterium]
MAANPILYADYPDPDVICVHETYYMISTSMHMFPGAQLLRSYDMLHWEHCAYVYDILGETPQQRMDGGHIYGRGMWAATLRHHGGLFHVVFTSNDTHQAYHYTAKQAEGPWMRQPMTGFWYDPSLLFDGGRVYIAHGNRTIRITELTDDLSAQKPGGLDRVVVVDTCEGLGWEGSHLVHIGDWYYLFCIHWAKGGMRAMGCFRAHSLEDDFTGGAFMELDLDDRHAGVAQGGPLQAADGTWVLLLFQDHGAVGRIPVVVPFRWEDSWPVVESIPKQLELPSFRPGYEYAPLYTRHDLGPYPLSPLWQWNHEPHQELLDTHHGLRLTTDRLAANCTEAINTLTQRCFGPKYTANVCLHPEDMNIGDYAGICALQGCFAQLAVTRREDGFRLVYTRRDTASGEIITEAELPLEVCCLQAAFDFNTDTVQFFALSDDKGWVKVGQPHRLVYRLDHFMGCRVGLFMYSTIETGGSAWFTGFTCHVEEEKE